MRKLQSAFKLTSFFVFTLICSQALGTMALAIGAEAILSRSGIAIGGTMKNGKMIREEKIVTLGMATALRMPTASEHGAVSWWWMITECRSYRLPFNGRAC